MLFEILKNAMRAVVERAERSVGVGCVEEEDMEPVMIYITEENEGKVGILFLFFFIAES
jgi:hypothetical protein